MATNIAPHNLNEIVGGCMLLLREPNATIEQLIELIPAPDFPTAGSSMAWMACARVIAPAAAAW